MQAYVCVCGVCAAKHGERGNGGPFGNEYSLLLGLLCAAVLFFQPFPFGLFLSFLFFFAHPIEN